MKKYDVIVCGGGTAGMITASSAARNGANTLLIEREGYPGGTTTYGIPFLGNTKKQKEFPLQRIEINHGRVEVRFFGL